MPPTLAAVLCALFVICLFIRDLRVNTVSRAVWIPLFWMAIVCSRTVTEWRYLGTPLVHSDPDGYLGGSALDRNVLLSLIVVGAGILARRSISLATVLRKNPWIVLFFAFALISITWSEFPLTAFKRWYKVLGHVVMALVVLTDPAPLTAFYALFRRCAYLLTPLSILFIKYYPHYGRGFSYWTGEAYNTGVTTNKNLLGNYGLIMSLFFLTLLLAARVEGGRGKGERYLYALFLYLNGWLLYKANSATCIACVLVGATVILATRFEAMERHLTPAALAFGVLVGAFSVAGVDVRGMAASSLNRSADLTGRTELWEELGEFNTNPLVGVGFESFWLGDRAARLWEKYWWKPNQAHNGYYETYLSLGAVGLVIQCGAMLAAYSKGRKKMRAQRGGRDGSFAQAQFAVAFMLVYAFYNVTEAAFKTLHPSFFVFFMVAISYAETGARCTPRDRAFGSNSSAARRWSLLTGKTSGVALRRPAVEKFTA